MMQNPGLKGWLLIYNHCKPDEFTTDSVIFTDGIEPSDSRHYKGGCDLLQVAAQAATSSESISSQIDVQ